jgi:hypothetical protein
MFITLWKFIKSIGKYQNRYRGGGGTRHNLYPDVLLVWTCTVFVSKFQFPETTERPGYFVVFSDNLRDALKNNIWKMIWSQAYMEVWLDQQQVQVIGITVCHLSWMIKNHVKYYILSQVLFGKLDIISTNLEILRMMVITIS